MKTPLWIPTEERKKSSNLIAFMRYAEQISGKSFPDYDALYQWSITDIEEFWKSIWVVSGIIHSRSFTSVVSGKSMFGTKWFEGAKLNFAENLLKYRDNHTAIISSRENYPDIRITYYELYKLVSSVASGLRNMGVKNGDRVAGFISNIPEAIIAMLAVTSIGAIWSSCSPDFGLQGVLDRFGQIKPKVLFAVESYFYNSKNVNCIEKINKVANSIPEIEHVILVNEFYDFNIKTKMNNPGILKSVYFSALLKNDFPDLEFEQVPFNHPVYIMYSSGTTGIPKCIVHGAGGTLLQHFKEHSLHTDISRHDTLTYFTTCGWMMWNWMVSSLQIGDTIFLYDGSPSHPDIATLWKKIEDHKITIFGTSPKFISVCEKAGLIPKDSFNLISLKTILSTGSPITKENSEWVYKNVKEDLQLSSISGGTDIISCFMLGAPVLPVFAGEIQCRGLGMKVETFDDAGKSVINEKGELVCTNPFPSMPVGFWNDPENQKYFNTYFNYYPGVWRHGDFIKINENGGIIVYGRSDATLNPGGVRIGTAEIYRIVENLEEVLDSIVIGQKWENDIRIILFVVLRGNKLLTNALTQKIRTNIKQSATPRHVPARIIQVTDIPRTISGKKVEIAVSKIINGEVVDNKEALANPESLSQFYNIDTLNN
ncbi:MAG: acetoacetate--CoA ligase [Ignavibacteriaceae bacterium]|nr:acetoacetate--CoA ligase [Ignavibacteriaceae bacterium]